MLALDTIVASSLTNTVKADEIAASRAGAGCTAVDLELVSEIARRPITV